MDRCAAEVKLDNGCWFAKMNEERIARGAPPRQRVLSEEPTDHRLPTNMAAGSILHYLPPDWTEETYKNPSDADYEGLSKEV